MPELPDVTVYIERLAALAQGQALGGIRIASPFVLRTVEPPSQAFVGRTLENARRMGKRIILGFDGDLFMVIHLMIAGRLHWRRKDSGTTGAPATRATPRAAMVAATQGSLAGGPASPSPKVPYGRNALVTFDFTAGSLVLTEAASRHRASLYLVAGAAGLDGFRRSGVDILATSSAELDAALRRENRTIKRALTDPDIVDGVGNAYSDEILHRARLSPFRLTGSLTAGEVAALHQAAVETLTEWIARLRAEVGAGFPEKVTPFHPAMAVHGKYGRPCPVCGAPVQRIVYASSEANYCARCQTGGRLLADRSLSRLLKDDWPKTLEDLEESRMWGRGDPPEG